MAGNIKKMPRKLTERSRRVMTGGVMAMVHYLLLPPSFYFLGLAWYLVYVVDDSLTLVEDMSVSPLPIFLVVLGVVNFLCNWRVLKAMGTAYRPSRRTRALRSALVTLLLLLVATLLLFAASIYCFVQMGRTPTLFKRGLNSSMREYVNDVGIKARLDVLQIDYSCCGDSDFQDWFHTPWVPPDILVGGPKELQTYMQAQQPENYRYINDDAPFSCCEPSSVRPCIHHHVAVDYLHYKYQHLKNNTLHRRGCRQVLMDFFSYVLLCPLAISLLLMAIGQVVVLVLSRLTFTSMQNAIDEGDITAPAEGYIFKLKSTQTEDKPPLTEVEAQEKWGLLSESEEFPEGQSPNVEAAYTSDKTPYEHNGASDRTTYGYYGVSSGPGRPQGEPIYENVIPDDSPRDYVLAGEAHLPMNQYPGAPRTQPAWAAPPPPPSQQLPLFPSEVAEAHPTGSYDRRSKAFDSLGVGLP